MQENWKSIWKGKTSKRVIELMGDNIGFFTDQFSIQDFFDNK